ncbi:unnamed protein product, partial [Oppiella nova]
MKLDFYQIDAFTTEPFLGNPAVVCILENNDDLSEETKQKIASEVNQPMTAFVSRKWTQNSVNSDNNSYKIQFFTPTQEFYLCGHATVGSVLVLKTRDTNGATNDKSVANYHFETKAGEPIDTSYDENDLITISFPLPTQYKPIDLNEKWTQNIVAFTLGSKLGTNSVEEVVISNKFVLIRLKDSDEINLHKVVPNFDGLNELSDRKGVRNGIIVTEKGDLNRDGIHRDGIHFYSRVFLPWAGVNEDPVCGSAHTQLMPYWNQTLGAKAGQTLIGKQLSQRPGIVRCRLNGDRVELSGNA